MATQRFCDGLLQGNLRRANQARSQNMRVRRTRDRERIEELPTVDQFRAGDAYNCMTLCVCVCVCVCVCRRFQRKHVWSLCVLWHVMLL